ncbi:amino acid transporter [Ceraceosorus guamensis]|uniref:Amino acid transporter n=1 Tax=Ceraceosorus guamensis TaxID=1522189 RepID=A0A316VP07_9BASI|nr:amino acid transporter [Ceraceosorus guamensis]PWN39307.1 amino acid transporter [Ceraceosorus guamensis]
MSSTLQEKEIKDDNKKVEEAVEEGESADADTRLEALGYAPEMRRNLSTIAVLGMGASIIAAPFGLTTSASFALVNGGAASYVWGWIFLSIVSLAIAASLGEICSLYPTSGGVYVWTAHLAPSKQSAIIASYIVGWLSCIANILLCLSIAFGEAQLIMAAISLFRDQNWTPEAWQTILCFWAVLLVAAAVNAFGVKSKSLEPINVASIWWTAGASLIILVTTLAMSDVKRSASDVFVQWNNTSGWPDGWSWFVGLLTPAYVLTGYGTISNLCEEVRQPERAVPRAMLGSVVVASLNGLAFILPLTFVFPSPSELEAALEAASGLVPYVFAQATGTAGGAFGLLFLVLGIGLFASISSFTVAFRCIWAFSRDGGLPGSRWLRRVDPRLIVPLNSLIVSTVIIGLLGLIYLGATSAFNAFTGSCTILLGVSYVVPIAMLLSRRRAPVRFASWGLGRLGWIANVVALAWVLFSIILFCFPTTASITPASMNYASVVVSFFAAFAAVFYFTIARTRYQGPLGAGQHGDRA